MVRLLYLYHCLGLPFTACVDKALMFILWAIGNLWHMSGAVTQTEQPSARPRHSACLRNNSNRPCSMKWIDLVDTHSVGQFW